MPSYQTTHYLSHLFLTSLLIRLFDKKCLRPQKLFTPCYFLRMSYWIRLSNGKLNEALIKSGKNYKPDQQGHDYLLLDLKKLKVFWNEKPVSKLSAIEIGSWIKVEPLGKDVANLGKEGRFGEFVKIFNCPQNEIECKSK